MRCWRCNEWRCRNHEENVLVMSRDVYCSVEENERMMGLDGQREDVNVSWVKGWRMNMQWVRQLKLYCRQNDEEKTKVVARQWAGLMALDRRKDATSKGWRQLKLYCRQHGEGKTEVVVRQWVGSMALDRRECWVNRMIIQ